VPGFRYPQFCSLARATEVLGQRWSLLVLRELFVGPQRFADLRRRLRGVSSSVLSERLAALEAQGVVERRELPPPLATTLYALTPDGRALEPALVELTRWGLRFLDGLRPGDHFEPSWLRLAAASFARRGPSPPRRLELRAPDAAGEVVLRVAGGPRGTRLVDDGKPVEATLRGDARLLLGILTGAVAAEAAADDGRLAVEGDLAAAAELPGLFEMHFGSRPGSSRSGSERPGSSRRREASHARPKRSGGPRGRPRQERRTT
jgi:DNA-binding HxlR family transcriptional regulator